VTNYQFCLILSLLFFIAANASAPMAPQLLATSSVSRAALLRWCDASWSSNHDPAPNVHGLRGLQGAELAAHKLNS